jgi:hypothetical protein
MDQYRRVEKQKVEDQIKENEIRVTTQGKMRSFISYATTLLKVFTSSIFYLFIII